MAKTKKLRPATRIEELPPYLFKEIDDKKQQLISQKRSLINLGVGDPDLPTPDFIVEALAREASKNENQKYPAYEGSEKFRHAVSHYMMTRFQVNVDPTNEVAALIGSKEGIAHFAWAFIDPGDTALVPEPAYPVYGTSVRLAGGQTISMPLHPENNFFPDLNKIAPSIADKAKIIYINYPNNPTGAMASREQLSNLVSWAQKYGIIIAADWAYAELVYNLNDRLSLLSIPGAQEVCIEFHSFSKTFNMTGWRLGFAAGNADLIKGLVKLKTNIDSGVFDAIQYAGCTGLAKIDTFINSLIATYRERRDLLVKILKDSGWEVFVPQGAFYVWAKCPAGMTSKQTCMTLLEKSGVVTTPGAGFGQAGEGYIRFALTQPVEIIRNLEGKLKLS